MTAQSSGVAFMHSYSYTVQTSRDRGASWETGPIRVHAPEAEDETTTPGDLAATILDREYRHHLNGDGTEPVPLLQVFVWRGIVPQGAPAATSATGLDSQWQATADLLAEIAADIRYYEEEKRKHEAGAAGAQTAINNLKNRLAGVAISATRMQMPQVNIAHHADRSREWVRKLTD